MVRSARPFYSRLLVWSLLAVAPAAFAAPPSAAPQAAVTQDSGTMPDSREKKKDNDRALTSSQIHDAVLWRQPDDIASRDLFYGQGGESHQPVAPFTFESEAKGGSNPKFDVHDARGKRWRVKLGEEARPEVVASRLLWAVGYFANDDYLLHTAEVTGLALKRGSNLLGGEEQAPARRVSDARFARKPGGQKKVGVWKWKGNPFMGSREFNGLRTLMAVINNWDLKDENNAVYHDEKTGQTLLLVNDVGATFATTHITNSRAKDKGNVESYKDSKFIVKQTETMVDFGTPAPPTGLLIGSFGFTAGEYFKRHGLDWIGKDIPRADAHWVGLLLAQLTHKQLMDAFRAGGFPAAEIDEYVGLLEDRIQQLKAL